MRHPSTSLLALAAVLALGATACGDDGPRDDARAELVSPRDGERVYGGVDLTMQATGITIAPAGEPADGTGHFHVIADHGCATAGTPIAVDPDHLHVGTGASTGTIYLEPGSHTLCLQVGDGAHHALDLTDTVTIEVAIETPDEWCDTVAELDALTQALEGAGEFSAATAGVENLRRLAAQLVDGADVLDPAVRADVAAVAEASMTMFEILRDAESEEAAAEQIWGEQSVLPSPDELQPGLDWVLDTCGVAVV